MSTPPSVFLKRALEIARLGTSATEPNPRVGAVVAAGDTIIGEGWHHRVGAAHAEVNAVWAVRQPELLRQATLYVTLEPCSHHGRTPPCANLILECGIPRVVVGCADPNPQVAGRGIALLREHGVEVELAADPRPFRELIGHFLVNQAWGRPFVTLKWAESANGIMGRTQGGRLMLTGLQAQRFGHWLRSEHAAILIGRGTALADDPSLDTRFHPGPSPLRILLAGKGPLPPALRLFTDGRPTLVVGGPEQSSAGIVKNMPWEGQNSLQHLLDTLYRERQIGSILVEGGRKVLEAFLAEGLFDEIALLRNAHTAKGDVPAPQLPEDLRQLAYGSFGGDSWKLYRNPATDALILAP